MRVPPCETYYISDSEKVFSQLSEEELEAAEESFSVYSRPVELYNLLQGRANINPSFLTRCLHYKLKDKHKRRVQLSVSISRPLDDGEQTPSIFPIYILVARPVPAPNGEVLRSSCYRFKRACKVTASNGAQTVGSPLARFILPDINELSTEFKSGSLAILLVHFADATSQTEIDLTTDQMVSSSNEGYCLMGKTPIDFIYFLKENSQKINLGESAQFMSTVDLKLCYKKLSCSDGEKRLSFLFPNTSDVVQAPTTVLAEELGAKDLSPLDLHPLNGISTDKLPQVLRQRTGKVIFKFRYYHNMLHKTEVTKDYTCPFCLLKCASYKGLECHLPASHDLFNYEFWAEAGYEVVIVSVKITASSSELIAFFPLYYIGEKINGREKAFYFCRRPMRRRKSKGQNQIANHAGPLVLDSNMPGVSELMDCELYNPTAAGESSAAAILFPGAESAFQSIPGSSSAPTTLRKLASQAPLQTQSSFHTHTAQPMELEQANAEEDGEDKVDDDVADLEDGMLDELVDATQDQKQMMHLWNSFKINQGVVADAQIPWACEVFSRQHVEELAKNPPVLECWKSLMSQLWTLGLLDTITMKRCRAILNRSKDKQLEDSYDAYFG